MTSRGGSATDPATAHDATTAMLGDLLFAGDFTVSIRDGEPVLDAAERSHMQDVGGVVRGLILADLLALIVALLAGRRLRSERHRRGMLLLLAAAGLGAVAIVLAVFFAVAFDTAFAAFHAIFFKAGTWQFGPESNLLRFFPEPFWFEIALVAGGTIVLSALLVALVGRRDLAPIGRSLRLGYTRGTWGAVRSRSAASRGSASGCTRPGWSSPS